MKLYAILFELRNVVALQRHVGMGCIVVIDVVSIFALQEQKSIIRGFEKYPRGILLPTETSLMPISYKK